jgi:RimJ/RimL family protein N-acetyltransferase
MKLELQDWNMDLSDWKGVPRPERVTLEGNYIRLEPLDAARHGKDLFASAQQPGADDRFRYLFEETPPDFTTLNAWLEKVSASPDPLFFAVVDKQTGRAEGRQALMRIDAVHGVIEIGNILWGPAIARTRMATEALYLFAQYAFDTLGYRRFEWKCNNLNEPSRRAAARFGFTFEGIFRQHMVAKGNNRDTAWFSIIDSDWPRLKAGYEAWLAPENFDDAGQQKSKLSF